MPRALYFTLTLTVFLLTGPAAANAACAAAPGEQAWSVFYTGDAPVYCKDGDNWTPVVGMSNGFQPMTSAQRDALSSPQAGMMIYNTTVNRPEYYNGATWQAFSFGKDGRSAATAAVNCKHIQDNGYAAGNGAYWIDPDGEGGNAAFQAYCDMTTHGGGWTLCASFRHQARGTTLAAGLDFLNATWNTAGSVFMNDSGAVQSHGNFCNAMALTALMGQARSSATAIQFTTPPVTVSGTPFAYGQSNRFTGGGGYINIISRNSVALTFAGGVSCTVQNNGSTQGSSICIGNETNYQIVLGNINGSVAGDHMCNYTQTCGSSATQILLVYAK